MEATEQKAELDYYKLGVRSVSYAKFKQLRAALKRSVRLEVTAFDKSRIMHEHHLNLRITRCLYRASRDGTSKKAFDSKVAGQGKSTLTIVRTDRDEILGAFIDAQLQRNTKAEKAFGGGRSFLFKFKVNDKL